MADKVKKISEKIIEVNGERFVKEDTNGLLDVPELGIEVEIEISYKGKSYEKIMEIPEVKEKIKNGWRLLSAMRKDDYVNEVAFLERNKEYSKKLKMDGSSTKDDFWVEQMFKRNEENGYVAGFYADSGYSYLSCWYVAGDSYNSLGVRFCRKKNFKGRGK